MEIAAPPVATESSPPPALSGTMCVRIVRTRGPLQPETDDQVAVEAPLECWLHHASLEPEPVSFGTTMRTPGDDEQLAVGLLYGEGLVQSADDIEAVETSTRRPNVIHVRLRPEVRMELATATRRFSAGSSCGVCGTTGLDVAIAFAAATHIAATGAIDACLVLTLPQRMRVILSRFGDTGGCTPARCTILPDQKTVGTPA